MIVLTQNNLLFALDSKTSKPLWRSHLDVNYTNVSLFRIMSNETQRVLLSVFQQNEKTLRLLELDWKTGNYSTLKTLQAPKLPIVFQVSESKLGIKDQDRVEYFSLDKDAHPDNTFIFFNIKNSRVSCQNVK